MAIPCTYVNVWFCTGSNVTTKLEKKKEDKGKGKGV